MAARDSRTTRVARRWACRVDALTGFVNEEGEPPNRPVGVGIDGPGALLVADDIGNVTWRITSSAGR